MEQGNFWFAFSLTLFAGLSTGIGAAIAFFAKQTNKKLLSLSPAKTYNNQKVKILD